MGGLKMSVIFITYLFFLLGSSPITGFLVNIGIESICLAIRIQFMHTIIQLNVSKYITQTLLRCLGVFLLSAAILLVVFLQVENFSLLGRILSVTSSSVTFSIIIIYRMGLNKEERHFVLSKLKLLKNKIG